RKLTFQLTPLLDLLLIVLFAQYMDVSHSQTEQGDQREFQFQQEVEEKVQEKVQAERAALDKEKKELADKNQKLLEQSKQLADAEKRWQQEKKGIQKILKDVVDQQTRAGDTAAKLFQIPEKLVEQALMPLKKNRSAQEIQEIRKAFQNFAKKRGAEVIYHLLTYEELRKRCDIWQIHIAKNGEIEFYTGKESIRFRAENAQQFESKLFDQYKKVPQPKGLVIVLLSVGNVQEGIEKAALTGLPRATDRMRADSNGRTRFEYAILGYVAMSPIPETKK
ncbi:hypothetical protein MNBD_PLANCTO02-136, partial [hydrothermal vent metagenome]